MLLPTNLIEELGGKEQLLILVKKLIERLKKTILYDKIILVEDAAAFTN